MSSGTVNRKVESCIKTLDTHSHGVFERENHQTKEEKVKNSMEIKNKQQNCGQNSFILVMVGAIAVCRFMILI